MEKSIFEIFDTFTFTLYLGNEHASNTKNIMILRDYAITTQFGIFDTFTLWVTNIRSHMPLTQKKIP